MSAQQLSEIEQRAEAGIRQAARHLALRDGAPHKMAKGLAWFSLGLGITEIVAPRALSRWIGIRRHTRAVRLMGVREVAAGIGILARPHPVWLWARVGGDALDLAALAAAGTAPRAKTGRVNTAVAAVVGVTALDLMCARQLTDVSNGRHNRGCDVSASVVISRPPEQCYRYWRDIERLPRFLTHLKSVRELGNRRSHWITKTLSGREFAWDAEMVEDVPNERIAWRSIEGADIPNSGVVSFEPVRGGANTIVRVRMIYELPARAGGSVLKKLLGTDPGYQVRKDLLRMKQLLETGEIATTEGQPAGRRSAATFLDRMVRI